MDPHFVNAVLNSRVGQDQIDSFQAGGNRQGLNFKQVGSIRIPALSFSQQVAIGGLSRDAANVVSALERLIAKKLAIKRGLMQQFLTGQTRLPGFADAWLDIRLGDVLSVRHGKSQKAVESPNGRFPILATGGQIGWASSPLYSKASVLIGRKGTINRPQYQATPFWTVDTLFYTEISESVDPRFIYYVFLTVDWRSMNEASGVPSLSASRVESVQIKLPGIDEQREIRQALDNADTEIELLRKRLVKMTDVRQGMMQKLLAGRTDQPVQELAA
jgi:type I restriction enzyme S subunit